MFTATLNRSLMSYLKAIIGLSMFLDGFQLERMIGINF